MKDIELILKEIKDENISELLKSIENVKETKNNDDINKLIELIQKKDFPPHFSQKTIFNIRFASIRVIEDLKIKEAVPVLIEMLNTKKSRLKNALTIALGRIGDSRSLDPLLKILKDDENVKVSAAKALGDLGCKEAIEPLIEILKDNDVEARGAAAISLGQLKDKKALGNLTESLEQDEDVNVRRLAAIAIGEIGDANPVAVLIKKLEDQFMNVSTSAADALIKIGDPSIKPLIEVIENRLAADALIKIGEPAIDELIKLLKDDSEKRREIAAKCLGRIGSTRAVTPLVIELKNNNGKCLKVMRDAIFFLCKKSLEPLEKALIENESSSHEAITEIFFDIGNLTDNGLERLQGELKRKNPTYQKLLIKAFGKLGELKICPSLSETFLNTDNIEVKEEILKAIIEIGPGEDNINFLKKALEEDEAKIKSLALEAIINTGDPSSVDIMANSLKEENMELKKISIDGLGIINNPAAIEPLIEALNHKEKDLRLNVIKNLGKKQDAKVNDTLGELLQSSDPDILIATIKAIKETEDENLLKAIKPLLNSSYSEVEEEATKTLKHFGINTSKGFWARLFGR